MCGIFGAIGKSINPGIIRALALANRERGTDSLGFFGSSGASVKRAGDPLACLADSEFSAFVDNPGWFVAGHTRHATHGKVTDENAHPFRFGSIIGAHNGIVQYPRDRNYRVDSEYLFDELNRHKGDYQAAFADITGYWGLSWFDGTFFYLQAHDNDIAVGCDRRGTWYYSSDWMHLEACASPRKIRILSRGNTLRFSASGGKERLPKFVSTARYLKFDKSRTNGKRGNRGASGRSRKDEGRTDPFYYADDPLYAEYNDWSRLSDWHEYANHYDGDRPE